MKGRPLSSSQRHPVITLAVRDTNIWNRAREKAIEEGRPLADIVEEGLGVLLDPPTTVRPTNT